MQSKQKSFDRDLQELRKEEEETKSAAAVEEKNQSEPNERTGKARPKQHKFRDTLWIHTHARKTREETLLLLDGTGGRGKWRACVGVQGVRCKL
jgi:hypothetical protein